MRDWDDRGAEASKSYSLEAWIIGGFLLFGYLTYFFS